MATSAGEALFRFGSRDGGIIIRESTREILNEMSSKQKEKLGLQDVKLDKGVLKKEEFDAFITLSNKGYEEEIRKKLADKKVKQADGEKNRFNYWR